MKRPSMNWPIYSVRYWDHDNNVPGKPLNDCFGNSHERKLKARSDSEARTLATKRFGAKRFHTVEVVKTETNQKNPNGTSTCLHLFGSVHGKMGVVNDNTMSYSIPLTQERYTRMKLFCGVFSASVFVLMGHTQQEVLDKLTNQKVK